MAFESNKKELIEVYTLLKILSDGRIYYGDEKGNNSEKFASVYAVKRQEHNGERIYNVVGDNIEITGEETNITIERKHIKEATQALFALIKTGDEDCIIVDDEIEKLLDTMSIYNLEAKTNDKTDLHISLVGDENDYSGFIIRSRVGSLTSLLNGGRAANLKFEQSGVKFATPTVSKINATPEGENEVAERMMYIERLGGVLKYSDVADKIFRSNLMMIDLHFPRLLSEMVKTMHLDGIRKIGELTKIVEEVNPLKIKEELITKHLYYQHKIKQFLLALALGMRAAKIYNGLESEIKGMLLLNSNGEVVCYHSSRRDVFENFLINNTRLDKGSLEKDKYGFLERENGKYYLKLNVKVSLTKR